MDLNLDDRSIVINPPDWSDKQILVTEDVDSNFRLLEAVLRKTSADVVWVTNGKEALAKIQNGMKPDIILMDIRMPEMNGYDATRAIKAINAQIPIIAQTAYAMSGEKELSLEAGCDDYISKPILPATLLRKLLEYLG